MSVALLERLHEISRLTPEECKATAEELLCKYPGIKAEDVLAIGIRRAGTIDVVVSKRLYK